jgi:dihydroorotate dehydrogenase
VATFHVSDRCFNQLAADVEHELRVVSAAVATLLVVVWAVLLGILRMLQHQRTERDRAQRDLIEQEQRYHRLVNNLSNYFVYGRDAAGRVTYASNSATGLFGGTALDVIRQLEHGAAPAGYELNLSCPNTHAGGVEFGTDASSLAEVVTRCRAATRRPLFVKLSPALPSVAAMARVAQDAGADGVSLVNTMPGTAYDGETPRVGNGFGGVSGPALRAIGLLAVQRVSEQLPGFPIIGIGGISRAEHVRDYLRAGASLVAIGTAALADPRLPERLLTQLGHRDG